MNQEILDRLKAAVDKRLELDRATSEARKEADELRVQIIKLKMTKAEQYRKRYQSRPLTHSYYTGQLSAYSYMLELLQGSE